MRWRSIEEYLAYLNHIEGFAEAWEDWIEYRAKEKRNPIRKADGTYKPLMVRGMLADLCASPDPVRMIHHSIASGYIGLYNPKNSSKKELIKLPERVDYGEGISNES